MDVGQRDNGHMNASLVSAILFVASLFLPAVEIPDSEAKRMEAWPGLYCLVTGFAPVMPGFPAWYANPMYVCGSLFLRVPQWRSFASILVIAAFPISLWVVADVRPFIPGFPATGFQLREGAYLWMAAITIQSARISTLWRKQIFASAPAKYKR